MLYLNFGSFGLTTSITLLFLLQSTIASQKMANNLLFKYISQALSLYIAIFSRFLFLFQLQPTIKTLLCLDNSPYSRGVECYSGAYYWMHFTLALLTITQVITHGFIIFVFSNDYNPFSSRHSAGDAAITEMLLMVIKMISLMFFVIDYNHELSTILHVLIFLFYVVILIIRTFNIVGYNLRLEQISILSDSLISWVALSTIMISIVKIEVASISAFTFMVLGIPAQFYIFKTLKDRAVYQVLISDLSKISSARIASNLILTIIRLVESRNSETSDCELSGILRRLIKNNADFIGGADKLIDLLVTQIPEHEEEEDEDAVEFAYYKIVSAILEKLIFNIKNNNFLYLIASCIERTKKKNNYNSVFLLKSIELNGISLWIEYEIFKVKEYVQEDLIKLDKLYSQKNGLDVQSIANFQNNLKFIEMLALELSERYKMLWMMIQEQDMTVASLLNVGIKILKLKDNISNMEAQLSREHGNNSKLLNLIGNIKIYLMNDPEEAAKYKRRIQGNLPHSDANVEDTEDMRIKFGENTNTIIVRASGNQDTLGKLVGASQEIKMLGYEPSELIGESVNIFIPEILNEVHDQIMRNYFSRGSGTFMNSQRLVFPLDKKGFISPYNALLRIMPSLDEGLQLILFLKKAILKEDKVAETGSKSNLLNAIRLTKNVRNEFIVFGQDGTLYSLSKQVNINYGISNYFCYGMTSSSDQVINLQQICPEFEKADFFTRLIEDERVNITLDTSSLKKKIVEHDLFKHEEELMMKSRSLPKSKEKKNNNLIEKPGSIDLNRSNTYKDDYSQMMDTILSDNRFRRRKCQLKLLARESFHGGRVNWFVVEIRKNNFDSKKNFSLWNSNFAKGDIEKKKQDTSRIQHTRNGKHSTYIQEIIDGNQNDRQLIGKIRQVVENKKNSKLVYGVAILIVVMITIYLLSKIILIFFVESATASETESANNQYLAFYLESITSIATLHSLRLISLANGLYMRSATPLAELSETETNSKKAEVQEKILSTYQIVKDINNKLALPNYLLNASINRFDFENFSLSIIERGETAPVTMIFNFAISMHTFLANLYWIGAASNISTIVDKETDNFGRAMFISINGIDVFRKRIEEYTYSMNRFSVTDYSTNFILELGIGLVLTLAFMLFFIPLIFYSNSIFLQILSYFYIIPKTSLDELMENCNLFEELENPQESGLGIDIEASFFKTEKVSEPKSYYTTNKDDADDFSQVEDEEEVLELNNKLNNSRIKPPGAILERRIEAMVSNY